MSAVLPMSTLLISKGENFTVSSCNSTDPCVFFAAHRVQRAPAEIAEVGIQPGPLSFQAR